MQYVYVYGMHMYIHIHTFYTAITKYTTPLLFTFTFHFLHIQLCFYYIRLYIVLYAVFSVLYTVYYLSLCYIRATRFIWHLAKSMHIFVWIDVEPRLTDVC